MQIGVFKAQADSSCVIQWHFLLKFSAQKKSLKGTWNELTAWRGNTTLSNTSFCLYLQKEEATPGLLALSLPPGRCPQTSFPCHLPDHAAIPFHPMLTVSFSMETRTPLKKKDGRDTVYLISTWHGFRAWAESTSRCTSFFTLLGFQEF